MNINMLNDKFWDINVSLTSFESKSSPGPYHYQLIHKQRNKLDSWTTVGQFQRFFVCQNHNQPTLSKPCLINLRNKVFLVKTFQRCRDLSHFTTF